MINKDRFKVCGHIDRACGNSDQQVGHRDKVRGHSVIVCGHRDKVCGQKENHFSLKLTFFLSIEPNKDTRIEVLL